MSELRDQQPFHRQPDRRFRTRQRDDDLPRRETREARLIIAADPIS
jgi:hypothetical protein